MSTEDERSSPVRRKPPIHPITHFSVHYAMQIEIRSVLRILLVNIGLGLDKLVVGLLSALRRSTTYIVSLLVQLVTNGILGCGHSRTHVGIAVLSNVCL